MTVTNIQDGIAKMLSRLPQGDRAFALIRSVVQDQFAVIPVCTVLLQTVGMMAARLNPAQRAEIAAAMRAELEKLDALLMQ
jgi:hypothetical protein